MDRRIRLLQIACWWGIIADALDVVMMLFPSLFVKFMNFNIEADTNFSLGIRFGVPLMVGWTILLYWASRKPEERKDILLLTVPVVIGYFIYWLYAISTSVVSFAPLLPVFVMQAGLMVMLIYAWRSAGESAVSVKTTVDSLSR